MATQLVVHITGRWVALIAVKCVPKKECHLFGVHCSEKRVPPIQTHEQLQLEQRQPLMKSLIP